MKARRLPGPTRGFHAPPLRRAAGRPRIALERRAASAAGLDEQRFSRRRAIGGSDADDARRSTPRGGGSKVAASAAMARPHRRRSAAAAPALRTVEERTDQQKQLRLPVVEIAHHCRSTPTSCCCWRTATGRGCSRALASHAQSLGTRNLHEALSCAAHGADLMAERGSRAAARVCRRETQHRVGIIVIIAAKSSELIGTHLAVALGGCRVR